MTLQFNNYLIFSKIVSGNIQLQKINVEHLFNKAYVTRDFLSRDNTA